MKQFHSFSLADILGHVIKSSVVFNPLDQSSSTVDSEVDAELKGPIVSYFVTLIYQTNNVHIYLLI